MEQVYDYVAFSVYVALAVVAIWGAFCVIIVWRRVAQTRFRNEEEQDDCRTGPQQHVRPLG